MSFDTSLALCGPLRQPRQMLAEQEYSGHTSIHDDAMAEKLGFRAGPIEGPTHLIRMIEGPLFVGEDYLIRREVVALSESKRTESYWVRTRIYDAGGQRLKAELLLNHATLKQSFTGCEAARKGG